MYMQPRHSMRTIVFNVILWFVTVMLKNGVVDGRGQADSAPLAQPCTGPHPGSRIQPCSGDQSLEVQLWNCFECTLDSEVAMRGVHSGAAMTALQNRAGWPRKWLGRSNYTNVTGRLAFSGGCQIPSPANYQSRRSHASWNLAYVPSLSPVPTRPIVRPHRRRRGCG
jgi:hypothetical protein